MSGTAMFDGPVLIANRGEIAVRVARTVRALGLRSAAVFVDADADALHVDVCDVAVRVGAYLDGAAILGAAARVGAAAIHPGYGFLSENAEFAKQVADAGLVWIGPPPSAIELMGDKGEAKRAAVAAGVPVVPAGDGADAVYPVVVKAVAGGGGKGMRVVRSPAELEAATAAAKREAVNAFGDDRVIVERYLERPRHIEVQVLADRHGQVVHLGERECSLQRRHQKVVEEAPSPVVDAALRARMGDAAVALARACDYEGAGTVEFIVPETPTGTVPEEFFFLEMNTRLQVEHPVTELVFGVDLVEQQLRIAAGEPLALTQDALVPEGHAIEARLYAEDPATGFLPTTGTVVAYREPSGAGTRMDSGIRAGSTVGTQFDPMLAKVIASGADRAEAVGRLDRALGDLELLGISTNASFTRALLARDDVSSGEMDTGLLERILADAELDLATPPDLLQAAALAAAGTAAPPGPWRRHFDDLGVAVVADASVTIDDGPQVPADIRAIDDGHVRVTLDGISRSYAVSAGDEVVHVARDGFHLAARTHVPERSGAGALAGSLQAPMPGTVLLIEVANGDVVEEGQVLLVLESMKMELSIAAPHAGTVEGLELAVGDRVALKQALVAVTAEEETS